jgi:hypothetical protein
MAILFISTKTWKQLRVPSINEWKNNMVHPYTSILFSNTNDLSSQKDMDENLIYITK